MPAASHRTDEEELHWLALRLVPGLGAVGTLDLVRRFRSAEAIFRASATELEAAGLSGAAASSISSGCTFDDAADQHHRARDLGVSLIPFTDARFPDQLRGIYDPPPLLFARGHLDLLSEPAVALIGTRRATPYGLAVAERLGSDLALAGLTVVSGMARGIDTAAHAGALGAGGNTIAVWGCGVDVVYPTENRKLADRIAAEGLVISEFPIGTPGYPQNFPVRNRIISGLSAAVCVVEGAQYSGSAITARLAADQGREVFAVPGNVTSRMSWATNLLIKQGARLAQDWNDIVAELPVGVRRRLAEKKRAALGVEPPAPRQEGLPFDAAAPVEGIARWALTRLQVDQPAQLDALIENLPAGSASELIAALFELEMMGLVRQLPGKQFVKVWAM